MSRLSASRLACLLHKKFPVQIPCIVTHLSSTTAVSTNQPRLANGYFYRNISFFSKKKFKEEAEEVLSEEGSQEGSVALFAEEEAQEKELTEEEIEAKRNISRLRDHHRRQLYGEVPHLEPKLWTHHTVAYKRRMYGIYGEKSGVNPAIAWPTREDLEKQLEYEKIAYPFTIPEMVEAIKQRRQLEKEEYEKRAAEVEKRMEMLEDIKAEIVAKQAAKEMELKAAQERKEKLMEEVRRHFGFTVDPKDERFQEMLQKKEKEQRKAMKEARKLEKQNRILEKLAQDVNKTKKKDAKSETKSGDDDDDK